MNDFAQALAEDRRLAILRILKEANGSANESVLMTVLESLGHVAGLTRSNLRADLAFLADRGLIVEEWFADKIVVAKITSRGAEVSEGRDRVEGVKRPRIGD